MRLGTLWSSLTIRTVLALYLALELAIQLRAALSDGGRNGYGQQVFWLLVVLFLVYRIAKGSATAWFVAVILTALPILLVIVAGFFSPVVAALVTASLLQLVLLLHLATRRRVGIGRKAHESATGTAATATTARRLPDRL